MLEMINDTHEPGVNSISDQTFRFNYINWLLLGKWEFVWTKPVRVQTKDMCLWKLFFSLNIGYDWVMKRWQFRAPWLGVFPRCHFINHRMALPISWFFPDYIDTQNTSLRLPTPEYIYQDEHPPSGERLVRNAKEMFWHWHVTYVWTLWRGEGDECASSGWRQTQPGPAPAPARARVKHLTS